MSRAKSGNARAPEIVAVLGGTGSGKTTEIIRTLHMRRRNRSLIWSPKEAEDDYAALYGGQVVRTAAACVDALARAGRGPVHLVFVPTLNRAADEKMFSVVCRAALAARDLVVVVDELHTVTRPALAPDGWAKLVMMGRAAGCSVIGGSQRPASIDKNFLGNCSRIHVRRLGYPEDAKTCAKALGVRPEEVQALAGFKWIERDNLKGIVKRG